MRLSELMNEVPGVRLVGNGDPDILSLSCDSRSVAPGALFAALPGVNTDGTRYVPQALSAGAVAVLSDSQIESEDVPQVISDNPRKALALMASAFYGHPSRSLKLVGITGTNGKTTVAYGVRHIARACGEVAGMLGTIEYDTVSSSKPAPLTTPDSIDFSACLAEIAQAGGTVAVTEASSHALSQHRVDGHEYACGVFTNLTRDHLDYHGSMEAYLHEKRRLFRMLGRGSYAVVNADDPKSPELLAGCEAKRIGYGFGESADLRGVVRRSDLSGMAIDVSYRGQTGVLETPLVGGYNGSNALAVLGAALAIGLEWDAALAGLRDFSGAPGRLERFDAGGVTVFVDYAHTDDALRSVLEVLKPLTPGRLIAVFGCGGDRDRGKRALMARAAEAVADVVVVTSDNPRSEEPDAIVRDIVDGFASPDRHRIVIDRREAVDAAVAEARSGDVVLVAGKGHEDYQIVGDKRLHLDDRELVRDSLARHHDGSAGISGAA